MHCVLVLVLCALVITPALTAGICDICKCTTNQGNVKTVTCDCNSQNKVLNITDDKMANVVHMTDFAVSNCTSVNFHKGAFRMSHDLHRVTVSRVHTVTLSLGVFSALSSLHVEDVNDLHLARKGFLGANLQDITIHRSNVSVLPSMGLRDVSGLQRFELKDVVIGRIETSAIKVLMEGNSHFIIDGCQVEMIEKGAIDVQANCVSINSSTFHSISEEAVKIYSSQGINVMKNFFNANCSSNGINVQSSEINIQENTFTTLPIGLLKRPAEGSSAISFKRNIVLNFTLMSNGVDLSTMLDLDDFKDNAVICDCNLAKSVLAYKAFQQSSKPRVIVKNNYCYLVENPHCNVSLQQISDEQARMCEADDSSAELAELCNSQLPSRGGRAEELPPDTTDTLITDTDISITTTDVSELVGASSQVGAGATTVRLGAFLTFLAAISSSLTRFLTY